jgi:hypothetical protein
MFTAYFDASGHEDLTHLAVAGFVSHADHWIDFDRAWRVRLATAGVRYFRMSEFSQGVGQFVGWNGPEKKSEKKQLLGDLMTLIRRHAHRKFGVAVGIESYRKLVWSCPV